MTTLPPTPRSRKPGGKRLESLALASQGRVALVRCPNGVLWLPGGKTVPKRGPVDFAGVYRPDGRAIFLDCKECSGEHRLVTSASTLPEHQRVELIRLAGAGAIAGLLCLATARDELYWCPASMLWVRRASIPWAELVPLGGAAKAVDWEFLRRAQEGWRGGKS